MKRAGAMQGSLRLRRWVARAGPVPAGPLALLALLALPACAGAPPGSGVTKTASAAELPPAPGLYASYPRDRLPVDGFPDPHTVAYFNEQWGVLYDEQGKPYGPNSLYLLDKRVGNPDLVVTDSTIANGRIVIGRNAAAVEGVFGHFLELLDLALHDLTQTLGVAHRDVLVVDSAANLDQYRERWGREYWLTHVVDASARPQIVFEPVDVLFSRKVAPYAAYNAVTQLLLQEKGGERLAPWLYYGLASYLAGEGNMLVAFANEFRDQRPVLLAPEETNRHLRPLVDRENGRLALYNAFLMTWHLCENWGFDRVRTLLDAVAAGSSPDEAAQRAYGRSFAAVTAMVDPRTLGEPQGERFGMRAATPGP